MKTITQTISVVLSFWVFVCLWSCQHSHNATKRNIPEGKMFVKAMPYQTSSGWGYDIYTNDTLYIRQAFIPGLRGRHPFTSREDALKTAELAIHKMAVSHKMPYISQQDLRQLQITLPQ